MVKKHNFSFLFIFSLFVFLEMDYEILFIGTYNIFSCF